MIGNIKHLTFTKRDIPVPADYRPLYKIGHILIILSLCCRSGKSSIMKLHFFCWAIKTKVNIGIVREWISSGFSNHLHVWGIEPTVNRALSFAVADGLINSVGGNFIITEKGTTLVQTINIDKALFSKEKAFLNAIGKGVITEQKIKELADKFL